MSLTVVLVRHGKAESSMLADSDETRSLTPAGRAAIAAAFPRSFSLLQVPDGVTPDLWVSPVLRARQTAEEVMAVTGIKAMEDHECLWEQDLDAFFRELDDHGGGIVIAVGHVPFMDRVSGLLCDSSLRFSTGGVAAIQLDGPASAAADDHVPGRLLWFVQGPRATQS